ncbi:hypothetical protein JKP88DRAFT_241179 [Tribonema minus]|uniref:Uncharacterized protein n=1 Tax=Tribonema minus TaxID=303371 RepID=A0A835YWC6_9STRA|nr:hypothetical protein JKP88DRAFT_241179 [Tribonema minus]
MAPSATTGAVIDDAEQFFSEYRRTGGQRAYSILCEVLTAFFEYTMPAYITGDCEYRVAGPDGAEVMIEDRDDAMLKFAAHYCDGDCEEALRIFYAVDSVHAYT